MKKKKIFLSVLIAFTVLSAILLNGCGDKEYTVKYEITGPSTVASYVTYTNSSGGRDQINNVSIPWVHTITVSGKYISVSCGAGFSYSNTSSYTAKIYVNNKQETSSSGTNYVSAVYVIK